MRIKGGSKKKPVSQLARHIGLKIYELRDRYRISMEELAEKTGISKAHICDVENGLRNITVLRLLQIANALEVEPSYFLGTGLIEEGKI